jgi:Rps23 Pro-64 3,4-dihydroxylase Tpa1-like proline 4-hydroxylase
VNPRELVIASRRNAMKQGSPETAGNFWQSYSYYEIYKRRFDPIECMNIITLHDPNHRVQGKISNLSGLTLRDSDLFWIPRLAATDWIFARVWEAVSQYNSKYGFELAEDMGQAQLTRYQSGQHYDWHMDLGSQQMSLRKITAVVELTSNNSRRGGGIEVFYGQSAENKVDLDIGDIVLFPSFVIHRASIVESGTRWSLVFWMDGTRPLQ